MTARVSSWVRFPTAPWPRRQAFLPVAASAIAAALAVGPAHACPIELSVYGDPAGSVSVEFRPAAGAAVTNAFRLLLGDDTVLDGHVMWTQDVERPNGTISYQCPDGDVTGPEYEACTAWQGVVYTIDAAGQVGLLPGEGEPAPPHLLFPDLAYALHAFPGLAGSAMTSSWEVFSLSGCQE